MGQIDLTVQYNKWLSFGIRHNYYESGLSTDFVLEPTWQTKALFKKVGIAFRTNDFGFMISIDQEREDIIKFIASKDKNLKFSFWLLLKNTNLYNFTTIPFTKGKAFYFSNLNIKNKENKLHDAEFVSEKEFLNIKELVEVNFEKDTKLQLIDVATDETVEEYVCKANIKQELDFRHLPDGKYALRQGKKQEEFVFISYPSSLKPLALVDFYLQPELLDKDMNVVSKSYSIGFERRATLWKYLIVPKYASGFKTLSITSEEKKTDFGKPQEVQIPTGESAYMFQSDKPLPLAEFNKLIFQLRKHTTVSSSGGKILMERLPVASYENLIPDNKGNMISEIYVYV